MGTRGPKSKYTKKIADVIIAILFFDVLERWMCGMGGGTGYMAIWFVIENLASEESGTVRA